MSVSGLSITAIAVTQSTCNYYNNLNVPKI